MLLKTSYASNLIIFVVIPAVIPAIKQCLAHTKNSPDFVKCVKEMAKQ
jgi:hypothetical protein